MTHELTLAERLISYDTSRPEEIVAAAGFVKGWLESRDIEVRHHDHNGLPVLVAEVAPDTTPASESVGGPAPEVLPDLAAAMAQMVAALGATTVPQTDPKPAVPAHRRRLSLSTGLDLSSK